ncbi:hypothetical protein ACHHYP_10644 [Achlya hypogyna]|uniref:PHD-type domain-containing protein n=1 Tax=Achlya hypogyna TaxID=1202772 RepID=A0A1V9YKU0_ACHHY|nr:hypothetical protein ACHHYP_10644 [Achlya hypogyna]
MSDTTTAPSTARAGGTEHSAGSRITDVEGASLPFLNPAVPSSQIHTTAGPAPVSHLQASADGASKGATLEKVNIAHAQGVSRAVEPSPGGRLRTKRSPRRALDAGTVLCGAETALGHTQVLVAASSALSQDAPLTRKKRSPKRSDISELAPAQPVPALALSPDILIVSTGTPPPKPPPPSSSAAECPSALSADHPDVQPKASGRQKAKRVCKQSDLGAADGPESVVFVPECVPDETLCINEGWCSICNGGDSHKDDLIVFCERCGVPVHQSCYGIPEIPHGDWFCHRCVELKGTTIPSNSMVCFLCQRYGGAMKPLRTLSPLGTKAWVHVLCVWWDPDVLIEDMARMEPLSMVHQPLLERSQAPCCLCRRAEGWLIKCRFTHCNEYFHAICARMGEVNRIHAHRSAVQNSGGRGGFLQLDLEDRPRLAYHAYCQRHATFEFAVDDVCDKLLASGLVTDPKLICRLDQLRTSSHDVDKFLKSVAAALVRVADAAATTAGDVKEFQKAHLQALQLVLDHLPQARATYPSCTVDAHDLVPEALLDALGGMFAEGGPDPFLQCHACDAAMARTEKVWYCDNPAGPHANHWGCLRQRKASAPLKRKADSKRPKRLKPKPPVPDDPAALVPSFFDAMLLCGSCDHGVDLRALVTAPKAVAAAAEAPAAVRVVVPAPKPEGSLIKARQGPPPSDRFRVERAAAMCSQIAALMKVLVAHHATPSEALQQDVEERFVALLAYVKPFDGYAHDRIDEVFGLFKSRARGPGLAMLKTLVREYTRLMYTKHVRAVEKAAVERKAKELQDAAEFKRVERARLNDDTEKSLKEQVLALKKKEKARERNLKRKLDNASKLANKKLPPPV